MENLDPYVQKFEHEVHVRCKRSFGSLLITFVALLTSSLKQK
ncbi:MAG TPA: hypothetical protein PLS76_07575 [Acinetobacter sp.]|jgi:hypothetical protein|nr:hypothetical protein [Acinetobacter sp.]HQW53481.1 hypothetical protein [Acinetobacter sp.]